jgi:glycosyltransferase involved in cell wall biosynthesis
LYNVDVKQGGFIPRDEYLRMLAEFGVFIAPRRKEGIGMAFLEQMAMGKCVISHNEATMNEYIISGETGILVDMSNPRRILADEIKHVRTNVVGAVCNMYRKWKADQIAILDFFECVMSTAPLKSSWNFKLAAFYPLYLAEGMIMRLRQYLKRQ